MLHYKKKSQISAFIIISIIIIIIISIIFGIKKDEAKTSYTIDTNSIIEFIDNCHEKTLKDAVIHIGERGGMYINTRYNTSNGFITDTIIYSNETNMTKSYLERSISHYISDNLRFCISGFSAFPEYDFEYDVPKVNIDIEDNTISSEMIFPIIIHYHQSETRLERFNIKIDSNLGLLFKVANDIIEDYYRFGGICITCLNRYYNTYGINTDIERENNIFILKKGKDKFRFIIR